jgi:hypothetical protein
MMNIRAAFRALVGSDSLKRRRDEVELAAIELEMAGIVAARDNLEAIIKNNPIQDPDELQWDDVFNIDAAGVHLSEDMSTQVLRTSRELCIATAHGKNIIANMVNFTIGKGMTMEPRVTDDAKKVAMKAFWLSWARRQLWPLKEEEIARRVFRDGEVFLRWFPNWDDIYFRFVAPERIYDPNHNISHGIKTKKKDVETVISYCYCPDRSKPQFTPLSVEKIDHIKIGVDSDTKRGLPYLFPVFDRVEQYDKWLRDRVILNRLRSAVALIRKHKGASPTQVDTFAKEAADLRTTSAATGFESRRRKILPGSIIDTGGATDYEFIAPNLDARDVAADGRSILLCVATGAGQTEYMVTGDASNANYSSTMVTREPVVKGFESWQKFFGVFWERIWVRVMSWGIRKGLGWSEEDVELGCEVTPSSRLMVLNVLDETTARNTMRDAGVISVPTWSREFGYDPEDELERQKKWEEAGGKANQETNSTGEDNDGDTRSKGESGGGGDPDVDGGSFKDPKKPKEADEP